MFCGSTSNCASAMETRQASRAVEHREGCLERPSPEVRSLTKLAKSCKVVEIRKSYHVEAVNPRLAKEPAEDLPLFESRNPEMSELLETAARAAAGDVTILLTGESGTGKDVLARQIHRWSPRRERPFLVVNCTTLADQGLESELFAHVRGSFPSAVDDQPGRGKAARGPTVFFDEIAELAPALQAQFLRFVQEHCFESAGGGRTIGVDVRIIAASSRNLEDEVAAGRFREDLYYRLNVITLRLPPLRERIQDILPLAQWMLNQARSRSAAREFILSADVAEALVDYRWPGNIRELRNALECAMTLAHTNTIAPDDLPDSVRKAASGGFISNGNGARLKEREREYILRVLAESRTLDEAAAVLGINVTTLWRKRKRWGIK
jgi:NtrC-family two-component system response regulator AlgB